MSSKAEVLSEKPGPGERIPGMPGAAIQETSQQSASTPGSDQPASELFKPGNPTGGLIPSAALESSGATSPGARRVATAEPITSVFAEEDQAEGRAATPVYAAGTGSGAQDRGTRAARFVAGQPAETVPGTPGQPPRDGGGRGRGGEGRLQENGGEGDRSPDALSFGVPPNFFRDAEASRQRPNREVYAGEATSPVDSSRQRVDVHIHRGKHTYNYQHNIRQYGAETSGRLAVTNAQGRLVADVEDLHAFLPYDSSSAEVADLANKTRTKETTDITARRTVDATLAAVETLLSSTDTVGDEGKFKVPGNFERDHKAFGDKGINRSEFAGDTQLVDGTRLSVRVILLGNRTRLGTSEHGQNGVRAIGQVTLYDTDNKLIAGIEELKIALPYDSDATQVAKLAGQADKKSPDLLEGLARQTAQASLAALETLLSPKEAQEQQGEIVIVSPDDLRVSIAQASERADGKDVPANVFLAALAGRVDDAAAGHKQEIAITQGELDTLDQLAQGTPAVEEHTSEANQVDVEVIRSQVERAEIKVRDVLSQLSTETRVKVQPGIIGNLLNHSIILEDARRRLREAEGEATGQSNADSQTRVLLQGIYWNDSSVEGLPSEAARKLADDLIEKASADYHRQNHNPDWRKIMVDAAKAAHLYVEGKTLTEIKGVLTNRNWDESTVASHIGNLVRWLHVAENWGRLGEGRQGLMGLLTELQQEIAREE